MRTSIDMKLDKLLEIVCEEIEVDERDVKGTSRDKNLVYARHLYSVIAKAVLKRKVTLTKIGELIGKSHCTILHYIYTSEDLLKIYKNGTSDDYYIDYYHTYMRVKGRFENVINSGGRASREALSYLKECERAIQGKIEDIEARLSGNIPPKI